MQEARHAFVFGLFVSWVGLGWFWIKSYLAATTTFGSGGPSTTKQVEKRKEQQEGKVLFLSYGTLFMAPH